MSISLGFFDVFTLYVAFSSLFFVVMVIAPSLKVIFSPLISLFGFPLRVLATTTQVPSILSLVTSSLGAGTVSSPAARISRFALIMCLPVCVVLGERPRRAAGRRKVPQDSMRSGTALREKSTRASRAPSLAAKSALRPVQELVQEIIRALTVDGVRADEPFDRAVIHQLQARLIQVPHLGELEPHLLIDADAIEMAALHHERARTNKSRHLRIVERAAQVELEDLVLARPDVGVGGARGGVLLDPLVEVRRADRQAVIGHQRRDAHCRLAAIGQPIERNALRIDIWLRLEPVHDLLVLRDDDREQRLLERVGLALERAEAVGEDVEVLRREGD